MQWLRAPFRNPVGQALIALTDWAVKPLRRVLPGFRGLDWSTLLLAWLAQFAVAASRVALLLGPRRRSTAPPSPMLALLAVVELLKAALWLLIIVVFVAGDPVVGRARRAARRPAQRADVPLPARRSAGVVPPLGGTLDLSPLIVIVLAQLALMLPVRWLEALVADAVPLAAATMADAPWRREEGDGAAHALVLTLHVQPGAKRTEVAGVHGDALKIRLAAPPVEGKANAELLRFLADAFGVPQRAVTLVRGETSRQKTVRIEAPRLRPDRDVAAGTLRRRCATRLSGREAVGEAHEIGDRQRLAAGAGIDAGGRERARRRRRRRARCAASCAAGRTPPRRPARTARRRRSPACAAPSGTSRATAESTFGAGRNAPGGTMNSRVTANFACSITVSRP